jgi:hypothetical protein
MADLVPPGPGPCTSVGTVPLSVLEMWNLSPWNRALSAYVVFWSPRHTGRGELRWEKKVMDQTHSGWLQLSWGRMWDNSWVPALGRQGRQPPIAH